MDMNVNMEGSHFRIFEGGGRTWDPPKFGSKKREGRPPPRPESQGQGWAGTSRGVSPPPSGAFVWGLKTPDAGRTPGLGGGSALPHWAVCRVPSAGAVSLDPPGEASQRRMDSFVVVAKKGPWVATHGNGAPRSIRSDPSGVQFLSGGEEGGRPRAKAYPPPPRVAVAGPDGGRQRGDRGGSAVKGLDVVVAAGVGDVGVPEGPEGLLRHGRPLARLAEHHGGAGSPVEGPGGGGPATRSVLATGG